MQNKPHPLQVKAQYLRNSGFIYHDIDRELGLPLGKSWHILNPEASRANTRDSTERYYARGAIPLCDLKE